MKRGIIFILIVQVCMMLCVYSNHKLICDNYNQIHKYEPSFDVSVFDSCVTVTDGIGFGSGIAISEDVILTARHCVQDSNMVVISMDGTEYKVIDKWRSDKSDLGFLVIDGKLPFVKFGCEPKVLDEIYIIGNPYSKDLICSVFKGIVSNLDRDIFDCNDLLQVSVFGAMGSSGSPVFNKYGRLIGIVTMSPNVYGCDILLCERVDKDYINQKLEELIDG